MRSLLALLFIFTLPLAHAAQDAAVTTDQAAIRERPALDAKVIESKASGSKIRISNFSKDGWYKVKASTGQFGWIWQADLTVGVFDDVVKSSNLEMSQKPHERRTDRKEPFIYIKAGGLIFPIMSPELSSKLGLGGSHFYTAIGGFIEAFTPVGEQIRAGLRIGTYSNTSSLTTNGIGYDVTLASTPILLGAEADVTRGEVLDISVGVYLGLGFRNKLQIVAPAFPTPNSFIFEKTSFALQANAAGKYWLTNWFAAVAEFGIFYTQVPKADITAFNGDVTFRNAEGALAKITGTQWGPMLSLGILFAF